MASKKKLLTSAVALGTAAVLTLGGTFAWQSINQTAVNEGSDIVNPGGRLHDDYDGTTGDKDVYVENFTGEYGENIYTRIRLEEYFKVAVNTGHGNKAENDVIGSTVKDEEGNVTSYDYRIFTGYDTLDADNTVSACVDTTEEGKYTSGTSYFKWTMGSEDSATVYYMPTFNLNKDSLVADVNGSYKQGTGVISSKDVEGGQYNARTDYTAGQTLDGTEIYDADDNTIDEVGNDFDNLDNYADNIRTKEAPHTAKEVFGTKGLISMEDWLALLEESEDGYDANVHGGWWVYDTDGWVYWSAFIGAGNTTGLLLDSIEMTEVMDDGWYYALNVVAQFITATDMGQKNGTGFYDAAAGAAPTENALKLLEAIGVDTSNATPSNFTLKLMGEDDSEDTAPTITVAYVDSIGLLLEGAPDWLADYSATGSADLTNNAVTCFTIGTGDDAVAGVDSGLDGIGANGTEEVFTFDPYGQLTLKYEDDTISYMAVSDSYIVVSDGENTWHGKIVVPEAAVGDGGDETGGDEIGGGSEAETLSFTVTPNVGEPLPITNVDSTPTLTYSGEATAFTFAFGADDTDDTWTLSFRVNSYGEGGDYRVTSSGNSTTIRTNDRDDAQIATWYPDENKLSMMLGKTLTNCDIVATKAIGEGSATHSLHIASITSTVAS